MAQEYRDQGIPTYIFSHNIDDPAPFIRQRAARWREAAGVPTGVGATLPLVLVNGGRETTQNSHADFRKDYTKLIDSAGEGDPTAELTATWSKVNDNKVHVSIDVKNSGELAFDPFEGGNDAQVTLFAVEHAKIIHLNYYAQANQTLELPDVLKSGQSVTLSTDLELRASAMKRIDVLAVVEYKKADGVWDLAQGVRATEDKTAPPPVEPAPVPATHSLWLPLLYSGRE